MPREENPLTAPFGKLRMVQTKVMISFPYCLREGLGKG
jgi:hypothetical protein